MSVGSKDCKTDKKTDGQMDGRTLASRLTRSVNNQMIICADQPMKHVEKVGKISQSLMTEAVNEQTFNKQTKRNNVCLANSTSKFYTGRRRKSSSHYTTELHQLN